MPTVEEAILTAIEFETRVRDTYRGAEQSSTDDIGRRVYRLLANEEQGHIDYLNSRLAQWREQGKITHKELATAVPPGDEIEKRRKSLESKLTGEDRGEEVKMLQKAEQLEIETSSFYRKMVAQLDDEAQRMFQRFVEIEEGHLAIVRAEIDAISGTGYFFDFGEFDMESLE
ncbi:MAG: hypothetical protein MAG453_02026 [Calditrichaeota bacterium]|nr:hypothetical protein [Calditrichota bacterium]